ncbi:MAG: tyrosine-protein phosphatase [Pseudomonadota bacterium]
MPQHPDRVFPLQGVSNFRDLGGYAADGGRPVRWRRLFRSDHFGALTEADRAQLAALGIARSFDFRGVAERAATPYQWPGVQQHPLSIEPTVVQRMQDLAAAGRQLSVPVVTDLMADLYRSLVQDQAHRFAELFDHLLQTEAPVVFHCTAGKDRTGVAAALLLLALGVPRATVQQDYLLTNQHYRHPPMPQSETPPEVLQVLWRVQDTFLDAALQTIETQPGGLPAYLQRLGLGPAALAALRARYLQPA